MQRGRLPAFISGSLHAVQLAVFAILGHQFTMCSGLYKPSLIHDKDQIGIDGAGKPVGDVEGKLVTGIGTDASVEIELGSGVKIGAASSNTSISALEHRARANDSFCHCPSDTSIPPEKSDTIAAMSREHTSGGTQAAMFAVRSTQRDHLSAFQRIRRTYGSTCSLRIETRLLSKSGLPCRAYVYYKGSCYALQVLKKVGKYAII